MERKVYIFDTTLRDGEQSPGASLTGPEKLEIARQLAHMNVDVIEAGFPSSSPGDFEAVRQIARSVRGPVITALARAVKATSMRYGNPSERPNGRGFTSSSGSSDIHAKHKFRKSREESAAEWEQRPFDTQSRYARTSNTRPRMAPEATGGISAR